VLFDGVKHVIGQCNNVFVFPGIGLGLLISEATRVTDSMFLAAARTLAGFTREHATGHECLYPSLRHLREVSKLIAFQVARTARDEGLGRSLEDGPLRSAIEKFFWWPDYRSHPRVEAPPSERSVECPERV
jgi:malate dehydrogenase (oxaloacetate-decarboxylating)